MSESIHRVNGKPFKYIPLGTREFFVPWVMVIMMMLLLHGKNHSSKRDLYP